MKNQGFLFLLTIAVLAVDSENFDPESDLRIKRSSDHDSVKKEPGGSMFSKTIVFFFFYGLLILFAFIGFLVWRLRRSKFRANKNNSAFENICHEMEGNTDSLPDSMKNAPINDKLDYLPYKKRYEIATENLEKGSVLGKGNFGVVKKGLLKMADPKTEEEEKKKLVVAVKSAANIYDLEQTSMLAAELRLMCAIGKFPNVLALIGAVTAELRKGRLLIVTEYVDCGDLHKYLKDHRHLFQDHLVTDENEPDSYLTPMSAKRKTYMFKKEGETAENAIDESLESLTTSDLLSFGLQIANGMQFLASIPLVHRDLALRNVLLKKNKTIRIADFGMARKHENKLYYKTRITKDAPIPVRWMSPEAVHTMTFTQQSDVWSSFIVLFLIYRFRAVISITSSGITDFCYLFD